MGPTRVEPSDDPVAAVLLAVEARLFDAIKARDMAVLETELAEDFVHASPGQADQGREAFLQAIRDIPYDIVDLRGEHVSVRVLGETAIVSGVQVARVMVPEGGEMSGATAFVDVFADRDGRWRLRHAFSIELPADTGASTT